MTQHHDPVHPDSGDLDPDELSAADDAYVRALLADLPDVPMPPEVLARIQAALAAEAAGNTESTGNIESTVEASEPRAAATVVPLAPVAARRATGWRNPRVLQAAAVVVVLVAGTVVGIKAISGQSPAGTASTAAGAAPRTDAVVRQTDHAYTAASLALDVHALVSGKSTAYGTTAGATTDSNGAAGTPPTVPSPTGVSAGPELGTSLAAGSAPLDPGVKRLLSSTTALAPCLTTIEDGLPAAVEPIAVDGGTYEGKPALVVVLPGSDDPTSYDVWIVGPTCGTNKDSALIRYQSVPRG
jgi:hypothetical protein